MTKNLTGHGLSAAPNYLLSSEVDRDGNRIVDDYDVTGDGSRNGPWEIYPKSMVYGQVDEAFFDDTSLEASHTGSRRIISGSPLLIAKDWRISVGCKSRFAW